MRRRSSRPADRHRLAARHRSLRCPAEEAHGGHTRTMTPVLALDFISPQRLWLLLVVGVVAAAYVALQWRRRHYAVRFTNVELLDKVAPKRPGWRRHLVAALFLATGALQVIAFAGPERQSRIPRARA